MRIKSFQHWESVYEMNFEKEQDLRQGNGKHYQQTFITNKRFVLYAKPVWLQIKLDSHEQSAAFVLNFLPSFDSIYKWKTVNKK